MDRSELLPNLLVLAWLFFVVNVIVAASKFAWGAL